MTRNIMQQHSDIHVKLLRGKIERSPANRMPTREKPKVHAIWKLYTPVVSSQAICLAAIGKENTRSHLISTWQFKISNLHYIRLAAQEGEKELVTGFVISPDNH